MAIEWHKQVPTAEQRTRSIICGHPIKVRLDGYDDSVEIPCAACGRTQVATDNVRRDGVPTPSLAWEGYEMTKRQELTASWESRVRYQRCRWR